MAFSLPGPKPVRYWRDNDIDRLRNRLTGAGVSVLEFIPGALHAGIKDGTNTTDLTTYIQAALDDVKADGGGTLDFPPGKYLCAGQLTIASALGVGLQGRCANGQHDGGAEIVYSGTASPFLNVTASSTVKIDDLSIRYSDDTFAGTLIRFYECSAVYLTRSTFTSGSYVTGLSALYLLDLDRTTEIGISDCAFSGAQYAIRGQNEDASGWCNAVQLRNVRFATSFTEGCIRNPCIGWSITGCAFQALRDGRGKAVVMSIPGYGVSITGNYFADSNSLTDLTDWAWVEWQGNGLSFAGNYVNGTGDHNPVGVRVTGTSDGVVVVGNSMRSLHAALDVGSGIASGVVFEANHCGDTDNQIIGTLASITRSTPRNVQQDLAGMQEAMRWTNQANNGVDDGQELVVIGDGGAVRGRMRARRVGVPFSPYAWEWLLWDGVSETWPTAFKVEKDRATCDAVILTPRTAVSAPDNGLFVDSADDVLKRKDSGGVVRVADVTAVEARMTTAETDITALEGRATSLEGRVAAAHADSTAADVATLVGDFNVLLSKLRAAGLLAT